jgi:branched-chain amino acid transport system substrate-binding protein
VRWCEQGSKWYSLSRHMQNSLSLLAAWVNIEHGGIRISSSDRRQLRIVTVDDSSNPTNVKAITTALLDGRMLGHPVDFLLGPYSSGLTEAAAQIASKQSALLIAPAAAETSVYVNRSLVLGMQNPSSQYLHAGLELLHARQIRSIALLSEDAAFTIGICQGVIAKAKELDIRVTEHILVSQNLNKSQVSAALKRFHEVKPDAIVGCTYYDVCAEFLKQSAHNFDYQFYVQAMLFTTCVTDSRFTAELSSTAAFVLGVTPWSEQGREADLLTGWSPMDFANKYRAAFDQTPPYQGVAAFAAGLLLVHAIEECGCLEPHLVAKQLLTNNSTRTPYGDVTFGANRQNTARFTTVQYDGNLNLSVVTAANVLFPMPTWKRRFCELSKRCAESGGCQDDGSCRHQACAPGKFRMAVGTEWACETCAPGTFSSGGQLEACSACAPGALALRKNDNLMGLGFMARANAGYFASLPGQPACISCDNLGDYYQELEAQSACLLCPVHTVRYLGVLNAANKSACMCKEGTHPFSRAQHVRHCKTKPFDTAEFWRHDGLHGRPCFPCPPGGICKVWPLRRASDPNRHAERSLCCIRAQPNFLILNRGTGVPPTCAARCQRSLHWIRQELNISQMTRHSSLPAVQDVARAGRSLNVPKATQVFSVQSAKLGASSSVEGVKLSALTSATRPLSQYLAFWP